MRRLHSPEIRYSSWGTIFARPISARPSDVPSGAAGHRPLAIGRGMAASMVATVILLAVSLAGSAPVPVSFTTLSHSEQSGVEQARQVIVRTLEEWKALWKEHAPGQPMPAVDFTKSMV